MVHIIGQNEFTTKALSALRVQRQSHVQCSVFIQHCALFPVSKGIIDVLHIRKSYNTIL